MSRTQYGGSLILHLQKNRTAFPERRKLGVGERVNGVFENRRISSGLLCESRVAHLANRNICSRVLKGRNQSTPNGHDDFFLRATQ